MSGVTAFEAFAVLSEALLFVFGVVVVGGVSVVLGGLAAAVWELFSCNGFAASANGCEPSGEGIVVFVVVTLGVAAALFRLAAQLRWFL